MSKIKLPKSLRGLVHNALNFRGYEIMEAYVDEMEYNVKDGLGKLREFLGAGYGSVCDCYCKIRINGMGEKRFLFEDKNSKHNKRFRDAKRQLEVSNDLLEKKKISVDFAVICRVSPEDPFKTKQDGSPLPPFKMVYINLSGKQVHLENSSSNKIPLLHL